jgi:hypothetical protein
MNEVDEAIEDAVDRLIAAAKAIKDAEVRREGDGVAIEAVRLRLRMIGDPCLRDLIGTGLRAP